MSEYELHVLYLNLYNQIKAVAPANATALAAIVTAIKALVDEVAADYAADNY
jgi:hypothetical protein